MKTHISLLAAGVIGLALFGSSQDVFGRPGGGRGGPGPHGAGPGPGPGPGARGRPDGIGPGAGSPVHAPVGDRPRTAPGERSPQNLQQFLGTHQPAQAGSRQALYQWGEGHAQPFTPAWYANHPNVWQATHPHADAAAALTVAGVATWLAVPYATSATAVPTTTVVAMDAGSAQTLVATGSVPVTPEGKWMTLGTFTLKPAGQAQATRVINLSVNPEGVVRGSGVDLISDDAHDIRGAVDKKDFRIAWTIGKNGKVQFQAPLDELTKPEGTVTAFFPDGRSAPWQINALAK